LNDQSRDQGAGPTTFLHHLKARLPRDRFRELVGGAAIVGAAVVIWFLIPGEPSYVTQPVARGALVVTLSAGGTLVARDQIDVAAETPGRIDSVAVDFDDHVRKGQVLARVNTDQLEAQLAQARAGLDQSRASNTQDEDTVRRDRALVKSGAVSPQQLVAAQSDYERAHAAIALASVQVRQDEDLITKATIRSPITGVVLDRKISVGQNVVAGPAQVLFTLAGELSQMEIRIDIDEMHVGEVHPGSVASVTVVAYPAREFPATLGVIHDSPHNKRGIVTYQAVISVPNREGLLKPGMTARATIVAARVHDALLVANAALRFMPPKDANVAASPPASRIDAVRGRIWLLERGQLSARDVSLGPSDGRRTAISGGDLKAGDAVVVALKRN
jgi:HlyD family secretion protein